MTATLLISIVSNRIAEIIASYFKPLIVVDVDANDDTNGANDYSC